MHAQFPVPTMPVEVPTHLAETPCLTSSHMAELIKGAKSGKGKSHSSRLQVYPEDGQDTRDL